MMPSTEQSLAQQGQWVEAVRIVTGGALLPMRGPLKPLLPYPDQGARQRWPGSLVTAPSEQNRVLSTWH